MECNSCPQPTALTAIPDQDCVFDIKQIQRLAFQRAQSTAPFTATSILDLAEWQDLGTAIDGTKIVVTPLIGGQPVIAAGDAITNGGGSNDTLNGVEEVDGTNPSKFSAMFKSLAPAVEAALKKLMCEPNLTVFFIASGGRIFSRQNSSDEFGLPVQSLFVGDRNNTGFGTKDTNMISFSMPAGWSESLAQFKPTTWNPLTDL